MRDFIVYYTPIDDNPKVGEIVAIAPIELDELSEHSFISIPHAQGKMFAMGEETAAHWNVEWDSKTNRRILNKKTNILINATPFSQIPIVGTFIPNTGILPTEIEVLLNHNIFTVVSYIDNCFERLDMNFVITTKDDPNFHIWDFIVNYQDLPYEIECPVELPGDISIYTLHFFNRYLFNDKRL